VGSREKKTGGGRKTRLRNSRGIPPLVGAGRMRKKIRRQASPRAGSRAANDASDRSNSPRRVRPGPLRNARLSARRGTVPTMARRRDRSRAALALVIYAGFVIVPAKSKGARSLSLSLSLVGLSPVDSGAAHPRDGSHAYPRKWKMRDN